MKEFMLFNPTSLGEAVELLGTDSSRAQLLAGGMDLLGRLKKRLTRRSLGALRFYETTYSLCQLRKHLSNTGFVIAEWHPIGHSFTLWGLGRLFRGPGYYETSRLAEWLGAVFLKLLPWSMCFETLIIARKTQSA